ncbi:MAG TPA: hypothetical protein VFV27_05960 [Nevskiaceae bacterium]|nr:hypothetical protein [Nevskiaceae bacterium]
MMLSTALRLAAEQGCEMEPVEQGARWCIRAIGYDADATEISARELARISEAEFLAEWLPQRL